MPYTPLNVPNDPAQIPQFLRQELENISRGFSKYPFLWLENLQKEPNRPQDGYVVFTDGVNWQPTGTSPHGGFYGYRAGAWHKLG
jgi:hypothetical protein